MVRGDATMVRILMGRKTNGNRREIACYSPRDGDWRCEGRPIGKNEPAGGRRKI